MLSTTCRNCIFSSTTPALNGCYFNLVERYKAKGVHVIDGQGEDAGFYILKDKICVYKRTDKWTEKHNITGQWDNIFSQLEKEQHVIAEFFVYMGKHHTESMLRKTVRSISRMVHKPTRVIIIKNQNPISLYEIRNICNESIPNMWGVELITNTDLTSRQKCIEMLSQKLRCHYFSIFDAGFVIHEDFLTNLNKMIYDDLDTPVIILPAKHNGLTISTPLFFACNCKLSNIASLAFQHKSGDGILPQSSLSSETL